MVDNIALFLMQVEGLSRKTIYKYFQLEAGGYTIEDIRDIIKQASLNTRRIEVPGTLELEAAYNKYQAIIEESHKLGIQIVSYLDKTFPTKFRKMDDPPTVIYAMGDMSCLEEKAIALIGTREPIEHGAKIAKRLGKVLGRDGYTVVSGLAYGCDAFGHKGCLEAEGKTAAVMAGGLDKVYPAKNRDLAQEIIETGGCLISEYPVKFKPFKSTFVERDRLQSGLSEGLIVVETDEKGGTWHTIEYAKQYGRKIGCYKHPDQYASERKTRGNQLLLKQKDVFGIENDSDLLVYKKMIDQKHDELMQKEKMIQIEQLSLFDERGV